MTSDRNRLRAKAIAVSRAFKDLFWAARAPQRGVWRRLFLADDGETLRRTGEAALADLRDFCFAHANNRRALFSNDPLVMARRVGRREVFDRITTYLNLDEAAVQQLMEIDDGI
jgi:hypothetical protein